MQEIGEFDVKVSVTPNGLKLYNFIQMLYNLWIPVWMDWLRICQIMILSIYHKSLVVVIC